MNDGYDIILSEYSEKELEIFKDIQKKTNSCTNETLSQYIPDYNYVGDYIETIKLKCDVHVNNYADKELHASFRFPYYPNEKNNWVLYKNIRLYSGNEPYPFENVEEIRLEISGYMEKLYGKYSDALAEYYQIYPEKSNSWFSKEKIHNSVPFNLFKLGVPLLKYHELRVVYRGICPRDLNIRADVYQYTGPFTYGCQSGFSGIKDKFKHINDLKIEQFRHFDNICHPVVAFFGISKEPVSEFKLEYEPLNNNHEKCGEPLELTIRATSIINKNGYYINVYKLPISINNLGRHSGKILDNPFMKRDGVKVGCIKYTVIREGFELYGLHQNIFRVMSGMCGTAFGH